MQNISDLKNTLADMGMSLEELIFDRLDMSYEDLLYDIHYRIIEQVDKFEDIERIEVQEYIEETLEEETERLYGEHNE